MENSEFEQCRKVAVQALSLTVQDWHELGQQEQDSDFEVCVEHISNLMLVRLAAIVSKKSTNHHHHYKDISTSGICRKILIANEPCWPEKITDQVVQQIRQLVRFILEHYRDLPFHNFRHAYHVVISANKLMDLMLTLDSNTFLDGQAPPTFGLRHDPIALMALLFAALIHDLDHQGVSNRQLMLEEDGLALLFNDNSMNENRSLYVAFVEFLQDDYAELRKLMFYQPVDYRFFRSIVVNMVLATDIANPERAQLSKSKWKEAFGDDDALIVLGDAPNNNNPMRKSSMNVNIPPRAVGGTIKNSPRKSRRGSNFSSESFVSDVTMDSYTRMMKQRQNKPPIPRKMSMESCASVDDSLADSTALYRRNRYSHNIPRKMSMESCASVDDSLADSTALYRRNRNHNNYKAGGIWSNSAPYESTENDDESFSDDYYANDSVQLATRDNRLKTNQAIDHIKSSDYAKDLSTKMGHHKHVEDKPTRRYSTQSSTPDGGGFSTRDGSDSLEPFAVESIALARKRQDGKAMTRRRIVEQFNDTRKFGGDDDSSLSITPPSSDDERVPTRRVILSTIDVEAHTATTKLSMTGKNGLHSRRASTGNVPVRFGSLTGQRIDEEKVINIDRPIRKSQSDDFDVNGPVKSGKYRKRLGIRRSIDFSGESIEVFARRSIGGSVMTDFDADEANDDDPNELRAYVVLELILRAADVAHTFQNWENMSKMSSRLFHELAAAHKAGRGPDPGPGWFDNQAMALESYVIPLTLQLDETGVFGEFTGAIFAQSAEKNRDRWLTQGFDLTLSLRKSAGL